MLRTKTVYSAVFAASCLVATNSNAGIISSVSTDDTSASYTINDESLMNGSLAFTDSAETWGALPNFLLGADYIQTAQTDNSNSDLEVSVDFDGDGTAYLFHSDQVDLPSWAASTFSATGDSLSLNGTTSGTYSLYSMMVSSGSTFTFQDNDPNTTNSGFMYGIAAVGSGDGGDNGDDNTAVPVPASLPLLSLGLFGVMAYRKRTAK